MTEEKKATMASVAKAAGVSISTVSRCLNQPEKVRADKLEMVRGVIRELGYEHPPPSSRRGPKLTADKVTPHRTLMFLWTRGDEPSHTLTGQHILHGAMAGLRRHGVSLIVDRLDGLYITHHLGDAVCVELIRKGIRIGKDLHVVAGQSDIKTYDSLDSIPIARPVEHGEDFGIIAADMLLWRLANPRLPRVIHNIPTSIRSAKTKQE